MGALAVAAAFVASASAGCSCAALLGGVDGPARARLPGRLRAAGEAFRGSALVGLARERGEAADARRCGSESMPVMIDVVTLGLTAGLSFDSSLELYCERYDDALSRRLRQAMLSWRIGAATREEALQDAARDLGVESLARFSAAVCEALAFGSPLAESLERQAQVIRDEQRSRVEEEIERVPVKMLIPLGTLIVPAMLLAILGPLLGAALVIG
ncbi:MAG: type II secretion system F family protein [Coriobacteriia bacterium]|nr:type II secretion system F family protein [Coriobacteriia bacterium]